MQKKFFIIIIFLFSSQLPAKSNSCKNVEELAQNYINKKKNYLAADIIENCLHSLKDDSFLYQFLGNHYHRRKQYQKSIFYYQKYFKYHQGTFTEKMVLVSSFFFAGRFDEIQKFIEQKFPSPTEKFNCENKFRDLDKEYLCYLKEFQKSGLEKEAFQKFLNSPSLQKKALADKIFWQEINAAIFCSENSYQELAMFLYQHKFYEKSFLVYMLLEETYQSKNYTWMLNQIGKETQQKFSKDSKLLQMKYKNNWYLHSEMLKGELPKHQ